VTLQNLNGHITDELEKLHQIYQNEKDFGRTIAYRKAISMIRSLKQPITSIEDVKNLPQIGRKMQQKIFEILSTGRLERAENLQKDERNKCIEELS
jgi:DNA polymerase/3'-5' exonuclease PolX